MLRGLAKGFKELIYPKTCICCKSHLKNKSSIEGFVCIQCWDKIPLNLPPFCQRCGRNLKKPNLHKNICSRCLKSVLHFDRAFSPCVYDGPTKEIIHAFKYKGKDYLGKILAKPMVDFIKEYDLPMPFIDYIVPVPLHHTKLREREFNQAQILGKNIADIFTKELLTDALIRTRPTQTQTELETDNRFLNVKNSFKVINEDKIKNKNILLVDDVLTSGATASEAALTLKNAGSRLVFVLTLAN